MHSLFARTKFLVSSHTRVSAFRCKSVGNFFISNIKIIQYLFTVTMQSKMKNSLIWIQIHSTTLTTTEVKNSR